LKNAIKMQWIVNKKAFQFLERLAVTVVGPPGLEPGTF